MVLHSIMAPTNEQYMFGYILTALRMVKIGNYDGCIDQINKLITLIQNVGVSKKLAADIKRHLKKLRAIQNNNEMSETDKMSKFKVELLDLEIIFKRHGISLAGGIDRFYPKK